ncbi:hypothetical protein ACWC10_08510 [Streptomyces sp. NPDC001595]|uniref:hypothetical protein n=1 Tax=Streptomyces sp. NPDC001532 TaxID=3154520 RepID=UPI0033310A63
MGQSQRDVAELCGRLYATLGALERIGTGTDGLGRPGAAHRVVTNGPRDKFQRLLRQVGEHLHAAKAWQNEARAAAATELFQAIPGFLPSGGIPTGNFGEAEQEAFDRGREAQRSAYEEKFGGLLS